LRNRIAESAVKDGIPPHESREISGYFRALWAPPLAFFLLDWPPMENPMRNASRYGLVGLGGALALGLVTAGCSEGSSGGPGVEIPDTQAIIFLQRTPRQANGNVFDYTSYEPGARLVKLEPASADGKLTVLTADSMWATADIMAWDLSFDAKSIVVSAKLDGGDRYHLFTMNVDGTNVKQLTEGEFDYVYPLFLPGQKLMFTTSKNVEEGTPQFQDEYERQTTAQIGTINIDGTGEELGPRNVSHRVAPAMLPDGNVIYTEWRHLGDVNDGHLRLMNTDMTRMREAFGGEDKGVTNSYLKARYVSSYTTTDGQTAHKVVAVATSRDRTLQAGKLLLLDLGKSEAGSGVTDLTRLVPGDDTPALDGVGRYYDAEPVGDPAAGIFLVSWSNGPVESEVLAAALKNANFGIYRYDSKSGVRRPIFDDQSYWDVMARPIKQRAEPPITASAVKGDAFVLSGISAYDTSLGGQVTIPAGSAVKVRLLEGFSAEEGISMFGTTEFDGQSLYGEVPVEDDGSFAARVPANVPLHMQVIDKFAVALADEPVWISGRAGEERTCGGCHEDRTKTPILQPGQLKAVLKGPVDLVVPRAQRVSTNFTYGNVRGVPWDMAIQPMLNAKCVSCHDGDATKPGNKSYTVMDMTSGVTQIFTFDLRGDKLPVNVGDMMTADFSASYLSVYGLGELLGENVVTITGEMPCSSNSTRAGCALAANAKESMIIEKLNPPQRFPSVNLANRFKSGTPHPVDVGGQELTPDEYYLLILNIDAGGQFFFRENKAGATQYVGGI
jgi:hypothetical protein